MYFSLEFICSDRSFEQLFEQMELRACWGVHLRGLKMRLIFKKFIWKKKRKKKKEYSFGKKKNWKQF